MQKKQQLQQDGEFYCYLKTKRGKFKKHFMMIDEDNNIAFFRRCTDTDSRQRHPLVECHLRVAKPQKIDDGKGNLKVFYPIQADIPPDKTRLLYFDSEESQRECIDTLLRVQGYENQLDQYNLIKKLGDGAFSSVMQAEHRSTNEIFAMKLITFSCLNDRQQQ